MKEEKEKEDRKEKPDDKGKVHVTVLYTSTAEDKSFVAEQDELLQQVIDEAYSKLGETRRASDQFFCHAEPRHDLKPYLAHTLRTMQKQGVCVHDDGHGKLVFEFDIDAEPGGAAE